MFETMNLGTTTVSIIALTGIAVEVIKRTINVSNNFLPAISIGVATVLTFMVNLYQSGLPGVRDNWVAYILYGLFIGASTSGVYDNLKAPVKEIKARKEDAEIDKPAQSFLDKIDKPTER